MSAATAPGARLVLGAQLLWVLGYIGLTPFFVLYAERELDLRPSAAASLLGVFGLVMGAAVLGAGRIRPERQVRMTLVGVLLLGGGFLGASCTTTLRFVAPALLAAAIGFGLVTTLGFPLFARFIPEGEEGAYSAVYFAVRSIAGAIAVSAAGWTIDTAGSYRALLAGGGAVALAALIPLARLDGERAELRRPSLRRATLLVGGLAGLCASLLALGILADRTRVARADEEVFEVLYGLGGTPELLDRVLVDPHIQNNVALVLLAAVAAIPLDVVAGVLIGVVAARVVIALLTETRLVSLPPSGLSSHGVQAATARRLRRLGIAIGCAAVAAFGALALTVGAPRSPDGGVLPGPPEEAAQYGLLAVGAVALALATRYPALGGASLLAAAAALGMLATLEYNPVYAVGAFAAFFVPGLLVALGSQKARSSRGAALVVGVAAGLAVVGALGAFRVHAAAFGPTHPESTTRSPPVTLVRWSWAGAVTDTGFRVVAKLTRDGEARLLVGSDPRLASARPTRSRVSSHDANDRIVTFDVSGLAPGRRYFYAVQMDGIVDRPRRGLVRTSTRDPFSFTFAFSGCARSGSNGAVFDAIRARGPYLFVILGDFFYANIDENDPEEFRHQYERALSRPAQAALYRSTAVDYVWDDHDFGANDADSTSPSKPAALEAYHGTAPHYRLLDRDAIYHSFSIGRVRFIVTDTRSARTPSTMLGARQTAWLERELLAAKRSGQLAVWVNSVPWIATSGPDSWSGYPGERRELANFVARNRIRTLLMLSGDAHMVAIDDGTNNRYATVGNGSFPVMHAAALDRRSEVKGGPYSEGAFGGSGQFGTVSVRDTGGPNVEVTLTGWNYRGERLVSHTFTRTLGEPRR